MYSLNQWASHGLLTYSGDFFSFLVERLANWTAAWWNLSCIQPTIYNWRGSLRRKEWRPQCITLRTIQSNFPAAHSSDFHYCSNSFQNSPNTSDSIRGPLRSNLWSVDTSNNHRKAHHYDTIWIRKRSHLPPTRYHSRSPLPCLQILRLAKLFKGGPIEENSHPTYNGRLRRARNWTLFFDQQTCRRWPRYFSTFYQRQSSSPPCSWASSTTIALYEKRTC